MLKKELKRYLIDNIINKFTPKVWVLIFTGSLLWSLTMVKSGLVYEFGMGFWGPNGHDGVWHIAISESLARGSWEMPIFAGENIRNYHIGFDLLLAVLNKITFIPVRILYFQIIPPILALLIGVFAYRFVFAWTKDKAKAYWSTFFVYFGGNFGWVVTLFRDGQISGESIFWVQQSASTLINPPFALSLVLMFAGLEFLYLGIENNDKKKLMIASFLFGILMQIKVYAGLLAIGALFVSGLWRMLRRMGISLMKVFVGALVIGILVFSPTSGDVGNNLVYKPFWFLETMMSFSDRLNWQKYGEAMVNYKLGGNFAKGIIAYSVALGIFWFGNLGTRIFKEILFIKHLRKYKDLGYVEIMLYSIIFAGILIPLFFVQKGTAWNTIQFMYYSLMISGVLAGVYMGDFVATSINKKETTASMYDIMIYHTKTKIVSFLVVLLTLPTTFGTLRNHYLPARPPAMISNEELEALEFLKKQPDGVVFTLPFDREAARKAEANPPRPLYLYESTAYVSAFSGKNVYLEDEVNLDITGYDWKERRRTVENIISTSDVRKVSEFFENNNIEYLYWVKDEKNRIQNEALVKKIFGNDLVDIYEVI